MARVVTYCRVSSDEQAQKDISIPAQRKALNRWVDDRPDHDVVREFVDEGESAYAPADKRPGFCEMIAYCRRHEVDAILVHKLDRFSRNREESIIFKSLLRRNGVQVRSITENFDADTPQGFLYEGMIEVINQFYSMNLATETLKGMRENAERGYHNGGRIPYGYRLEKVTEGGREHSKLVPGPDEEVTVVREIFEMATSRRMGGKRIANELNSREVPGPRSPHWSASTVAHILNNQVYVGDQVWFRSKKAGRHGRERTEEDDWLVTEDAHEALVDRDVFERRKELAKTRQFDVRSRDQQVTYLLSRLMRCSCCGSNFVGRRQKHKVKGGNKVYYRYYCGGYLSKGSAVCPSLPIGKEWAETAVLKKLRQKLCGKGRLDALEAKVRKRIEARRQAYGTNPEAVAQKLRDIDRQIENYYRAIGAGMDVEVCQRHIDELSTKKEEMAEEAAVLQQEDYYDRAMALNIEELRRFAEVFEKKFDDLPLGARREVILKFVDQIIVLDREKLQLHLHIPLDNRGIKHLADEMESEGDFSSSGDAAEDQLRGSLPQMFTSGAARGAILNLNAQVSSAWAFDVGSSILETFYEEFEQRPNAPQTGLELPPITPKPEDRPSPPSHLPPVATA